jgi:hypothetical protein
VPNSLLIKARRQAGTFSLSQALACGMSESRLRRLVSSGVLVVPARGVFATATTPRTSAFHIWVAVLRIGDPVALSGLTACAEHGLSGASTGGQVHLGVPYARDPAAVAGVKVRRLADWDRYQVVRVNGLPVLCVRDAIATAAERASAARLLTIIQDAAFKQQVDPAELALLRRSGFPGSRRLGQALTDYLSGHDSKPEVMSFSVLERGGQRPDHVNVRLASVTGEVSSPVDFYYEDGLVGEVDGAQHRTPDQRARDAQKTALITSFGAEVARWTPAQLADGTAYVSDVASRRAALRDVPEERLRRIAAIEVRHLRGRSCCCGHQG